MELSKRAYAAVLWSLAGVLGGIVLFDIYEDWQVEGNPLAVTLAENVVPLMLVGSLLYATRWLYFNADRASLATVTKWTGVGIVGILVLSAWVFTLQVVQGNIKPVILTAHTALGGAVGGVFVGYNVAQLRRTRAETEREKRRWESLFDNAPTAIADLAVESDDLTIASTNEAFREWFGGGGSGDSDGDDGAATGDFEERRFSSIVSLDEVEADLRDHVESETVLTTELTRIEGDELAHYILRFVPYRVGERDRRAYAILTDVTDLKETERELQETVADLERSNEQLEQFAYVASHDLQEPIRMVSSYVDLLASEYADEFDEEADEYVEYAVNGAERMQDMIDALLEYSRVETRGEEFEPTDADAVLARTLQDLELLVEDTGATVAHDDLPTVVADGNQLAQLFQNLIKNAIEHAAETDRQPHAGPPGDDPPTVRVGVEERDDAYVFSVEDEGPGIPEDQQDSVFEIFEQGARDNEGTGMGLAICERIADRHDGDIWVESTVGEGTTFYFSIPKR